MHRVSVTVILLLIACLAHAEGPPPDPSRGESYDGATHTASATEDLLWVPRVLLAPVRFLFRAIAVPVHHLLDWDEVNHVHETVFAGFTSRDGTIGVRPSFQYSISFCGRRRPTARSRPRCAPSTTCATTRSSPGSATRPTRRRSIRRRATPSIRSTPTGGSPGSPPAASPSTSTPSSACAASATAGRSATRSRSRRSTASAA